MIAMTMSSCVRGLLLACLLTVGAVLPTRADALDADLLSGAWYQPSQSGHGFTVEVLDAHRAVVLWFVYDPQGRPVHLYIDGQIDTSLPDRVRIAGPVYLSRGMRFGVFDANAHTLTPWGEATLTFNSCRNGEIVYDANGPAGAGYGAGTIALVRLSAIGGQFLDDGNCARHVDDEGGVLYRGGYRNNASPTARAMLGAADTHGVIWLAARVVPAEQPANELLPVIEARLTVSTFVARLSNLFVSAQENFLERSPSFVAEVTQTAQSRVGPFHQDFTADPRLLSRLDVEPDFNSRALLQRPLDFAAFGQTEFVQDIGAGGDPPVLRRITIGADGALCVIAVFDTACEFTGQAKIQRPGWSFFDFELRAVDDPDIAPIRGLGWVLPPATAQASVTLTLIGSRDGRGFVFDGYERERR